ncbi:MAG: polyprenyl diphosphate synthase, partial [Gammaproteobacteria bacterium]
RWAQNRRLPRHRGHKAGVEAVRAVVEQCSSVGIQVLTLFAFSSENWRRPRAEVRLLMELFISTLGREARRLHRNNVRLMVIGDREAFPERLQQRIRDAEELTRENTGLTLVIAGNYGGRWDIAQAARQLAAQVQAGTLQPIDITPERLQDHMALHGVPEPDLFIRTGGEQRISNFLLWQLAYSELYFTEVLWPDFDTRALAQALDWFSQRQRRFGLTGQQVEAIKGA